MRNKDQQRIVDLQKQLKIARAALWTIGSGCRVPESIAIQAIDEIWALDKKQPLQGLVGHEKSVR